MLDLDLSTILWEIVNFLVIAVVLYFLVFKPMAIRAETRAVEKARLKAELERDRDEAAAKLEEIDDRLINLEDEIQRISDEAYAGSQLLQKNLLAATYEEANSIMLEAVQESRKEQLVDIRNNQIELVNNVLGITLDTLAKVTPPEVHTRLLEELATSIWNMGKTDIGEVQRVRESLEGRNAVIEVSVPSPLTPEQQLRLVNTFNALTDREVDLEVSVRPDMVAGIRARVGDIIVDNSIGNLIERMRAEVTTSLQTFSPVQDE